MVQRLFGTESAEALLPVVDPHCPYCALELARPPSRKARCPSCGNQVYVTTGLDRRRYLVTRQQAGAIEAEQMLVRRREEAAHKVAINVSALRAGFET